MKEKKQFFIPRNYDKKFEFIPGISGWANLALIPVAAADYFILQHTPFSLSHKATLIVIVTGVSYILMGTKPIRENVSLWQHLVWKLKFINRQKKFMYKKEGYVNVIEPVKEERKHNKRFITKRTRKKEKIRTRAYTFKVDRKRIAHYSRQEDSSVPKSVSR